MLVLGINMHAQEENYDKDWGKENSKSTVTYNDDGTSSKGWDWQKARFGGAFSMQFGDLTQIELSPSFGYYAIDRLLVGGGFKFLFLKVKDGLYLGDIGGSPVFSNGTKDVLYGPSVFTQFTVWDQLYLHAEYELINKEPVYDLTNQDRINVSHLLIGGGYAVPVGNSGNFYISALFNVLDTKESIYEGTFGTFPLILRMGFGFGVSGNRSRN